MRRSSGYTLVELIVVLVILGVATISVSIGVSSFNKSSADRYLESLSSVFKYARYKSMTSPTDDVELVIEKSDGMYVGYVYTGSKLDKEYSICYDRFPLVLTVDSINNEVTTLVVKFNKSNGCFRYISYNSSNNVLGYASSVSIGTSGTDMHLILALETGRVVVCD